MIVLTRRATHFKSQNSRKQTASTKHWVEAKRREIEVHILLRYTFDLDTKQALSTLFFSVHSSRSHLHWCHIERPRERKEKKTDRNPWEEKLCVKEKVDRNQIKRDCLLVKANTVSPWKFLRKSWTCACVSVFVSLKRSFLFHSHSLLFGFFFRCSRNTKNNPLKPNETLTFSKCTWMLYGASSVIEHLFPITQSVFTWQTLKTDLRIERTATATVIESKRREKKTRT